MGTGTQIGRVRGLGSAKAGTGHWWQQRVTALANLVLVVWLIASLVMLPGHDYHTMIDWLRQPLVTVPVVLMILSIFNHMKLGLQVVIEDYFHSEGSKIAALLALKAYAVAGAAVAVFCVLKIAFGA